MATATDARNLRAKNYVLNQLARAGRYTVTKEDQAQFSKELKILDDLIPISAMGFRGVVPTAIVGKHLDPKFDPLHNFYDCNPRSIFENGIFYALQERQIPCGKSDPLNVAKNIQKLDYAWAQGRRPELAARGAVDYLKALERDISGGALYEKLVLLFFVKLLEYAKFVRSQNAPIEEFSGDASAETADRLVEFLLTCPEGGTIPQFIVGNLIRLMRAGNPLYRAVEGVDESVFGTNTTSKKPSDIWELMANGDYGNLYKITVKKIDEKRLNDCVGSLQQLKTKNISVTFICRIPEDIALLDMTRHSLSYKGVGFQFVDIKSFVTVTYITLREKSQLEFVKQLEAFVHHHNRPVRTKLVWGTVFVKQKAE